MNLFEQTYIVEWFNYKTFQSDALGHIMQTVYKSSKGKKILCELNTRMAKIQTSNIKIPII